MSTSRTQAIAMILGLFACTAVLSAQNRTPFAKAYEDTAFKIWYMHWQPRAVPVEPYRHHGSAVAVFLDGGTLRLSSGATEVRTAGDVVYYAPDGIANAGELVTSAPARALIVEFGSLQSWPQSAFPGITPAFPRSNAVTLLENSAVRVWDLQYRPDQPLPAHVYLKHTVQVWLTQAVVERAHPNEPPQQDARARGQFEIVHAGNVMSEHVLGGPARVIAIEPK